MAGVVTEAVQIPVKVSQAVYIAGTQDIHKTIEDYTEDPGHTTSQDHFDEGKTPQQTNEIPIDQMHATYDQDVERGCFSSARPSEKQVLQNNKQIFTTREIAVAPNIVDGAPSSGTRLLHRRDLNKKEQNFWNEAAPGVEAASRKPRAQSSESIYWSQSGNVQVAPPHRSCIGEPQVAGSSHPNARSCGGLGSWFGTWFLEEQCEPSVENADNMSESQFWGQAKTHGVNDIVAKKVNARWEQEAAVEGTLSTNEYKEKGIHQVAPMFQGPTSVATKSKMEAFWGDANEQAVE